MKRPQLGLRLILLLVALVAIWLTWFRVKCEQRSADWERATFDLRRQVEEFERQRSAIEARYKDIDPNDQPAQSMKQEYLNGIDMRIKDLQQQIDAVKK